MAIDKTAVKYVAHLARIELEETELEELSLQLHKIVGFIDKISKLNLKEVNPTSHILPKENILRPDVLRESIPSEKVLKNAPLKKDNYFLVPRVIE